MPMKLSGTAAIELSSMDTMVLYYQSQNRSIIEVSYPSSIIGDSDASTSATWKVVTNDADERTPLSRTQSIDPVTNQVVYSLFFAKNGYLAQVNQTKGSSSWSISSILTREPLMPGTNCLSACGESTYMKGMRVYYGSSWGFIREIGYTSTDNTWTNWQDFPATDPLSGVATTMQVTAGNSTKSVDLYVNLYFRNTTTGTVQQAYWAFGSADYKGPWAWLYGA